MSETDARGSILSAEELAELRQEHQPWTDADGVTECDGCGDPWPCKTARLTDALAQADAARQEAISQAYISGVKRDELSAQVAAQAERITHLETERDLLTGACLQHRVEMDRLITERDEARDRG